jgi:hypothetical protein
MAVVNGENAVDTLNGLFKEVYADSLADAKPKGLHITRDIPFVERSRMPGNEFHQPVSLTHEHGFSYAAAASGAFSLNAAIAHNTKDAKIVGTQMLLRSRIDYETAARASSGGNRAFRQALDVVVENMNDSARKRNEIDFLYGQNSLGWCSTVNFTTKVLTIRATHFAPGIWAGQEGARIIAMTQITSTSTIINQPYTISKVDIEARQITVTGTTTSALTGNPYIFFLGQRAAATNSSHNVFKGIHTLLAATSGTVLNINVGSFSLWKANQYGNGGAELAFAGVNGAVAAANGKGLDEDVTLYINPEVWADLLDDEAAQRRHVNPGGSGAFRVGQEGIEFFSQNGTIMIKSSRYVKKGFGYLISPRLWKRVGATDLTFRLPDRGDEFFRHIEDAAGYELRAYSNQAMFTKALAKATLIKAII